MSGINDFLVVYLQYANWCGWNGMSEIFLLNLLNSFHACKLVKEKIIKLETVNSQNIVELNELNKRWNAENYKQKWNSIMYLSFSIRHVNVINWLRAWFTIFDDNSRVTRWKKCEEIFNLHNINEDIWISRYSSISNFYLVTMYIWNYLQCNSMNLLK